jgi:hypothetical protein
MYNKNEQQVRLNLCFYSDLETYAQCLVLMLYYKIETLLTKINRMMTINRWPRLKKKNQDKRTEQMQCFKCFYLPNFRVKWNRHLQLDKIEMDKL